MKFSNINYEDFVNKFYIIKNSKLAKNFLLEIHVQKGISLSVLDGSNKTNERSKFKLNCVKLGNSYILMIDLISFKLRLINIVHFF